MPPIQVILLYLAADHCLPAAHRARFVAVAAGCVGIVRAVGVAGWRAPRPGRLDLPGPSTHPALDLLGTDLNLKRGEVYTL